MWWVYFVILSTTTTTTNVSGEHTRMQKLKTMKNIFESGKLALESQQAPSPHFFSAPKCRQTVSITTPAKESVQGTHDSDSTCH